MSSGPGPGPGPGPGSSATGDPLFVCQWHPQSLPVEIFQAILSHLTRDDAKRMRLVSQEFDAKVSSLFFHSVVVPFTADIYTANPETGIKYGHPQLASAKMNQGLRIFQSFGQHIKRFALSLELDETILASPPLKSSQRAVPTFWGIYRWPHESYARYMQFQDLEDTADQLLLLKQALVCLTGVRQLALCCDPGLGYLNGPERKAGFCPGPQPVFGGRDPRYQKSQALARQNMPWKALDEPLLVETSGDKRAAIAAMMVHAGLAPKQADAGVDLLLRTENVLLSNIILDGSRHSDDQSNPGAHVPQTSSHEVDQPPVYPLLPKQLTTAQKEILLEFDWAVRALVESYTIAIGDLSRTGRFSQLTQLTIAKIPSSHLNPFKRHLFWDSLPSLEDVSFAVQPNWRSVSLESLASSEKDLVSPANGVAEVYELLSAYVSRKANIKALHFEWICGGEFAVGANSRDRFILPAPFCLAEDMIRHDIALHPASYISLPHVQRLSLKNCYSTPYLLMQIVRDMARQSLVTLEFESFSLTGPPRLTGGNTSAQDHGVFGVLTLFSWPGFLEHFTPLTKFLDTIPNQDERAEAIRSCYNQRDKAVLTAPVSRNESLRDNYKLRNLSFKSCGYVNVTHDQTHLSKGVIPPEIAAVRNTSLSNIRLAVYLQSWKDGQWGYVASGLDPRESQILRGQFGMRFGWIGVYEEWVAMAALEDEGNAGHCRFSGSLNKVPATFQSRNHPDSN